jgi:hypothetical protein
LHSRFKEELVGISKIFKLLKFIFPLAFISGIVFEGYSIEMLVLVIVSFFSFPLETIKSINKTIKLCHKTIENNRKLSFEEKKIGEHLLIKDFIETNKQKIVSIYITFGFFLALYIVLDVNDMMRQFQFVFSSIAFFVMLAVWKLFELFNILKYFKTVLEEAQSKEYFRNLINERLLLKWGYYKKKWIMEIVFLSLPSVMAIYLFFSDKTRDEVIIFFFASLLLLLFCLSHDAKKISIRSLKIMKQYDDALKDNLRFKDSD